MTVFFKILKSISSFIYFLFLCVLVSIPIGVMMEVVWYSSWFYLALFGLFMLTFLLKLDYLQRFVVILCILSFIFLSAYVVEPPHPNISKIEDWFRGPREINDLFSTRIVSYSYMLYHENMVHDFKILMLFIPSTIGLCYFLRNKRIGYLFQLQN